MKETAQIRINAGRNELMLSALRVQVDPTVRRKGARNYKAIRELQREAASALDRCSVLAVLFSSRLFAQGFTTSDIAEPRHWFQSADR